MSSKKLHRIDWTRVTHNDIDKYRSLVSQRISVLPSDIMDCSVPDCSSHHNALDSYGSQLASILLSSAFVCFPTRSVSKSHRRLVGWSHSVTRLKQSSAFWYKIWLEASCPSSEVLSQMKKSSKTRYKYAVRRLRHRQDALLQKKLAN